jgi:RNA polymerase sigma-70 factor (ECF subfamily)
MGDGDSFADCMARLRAGEEGAAREIFRRYAEQLVLLARRRFNPALLRKVDPEDVVQSVYKSFFVRYGAGDFELAGWGSLWGLLVAITVRKCSNRIQYHRRVCRAAAREVPLPAADGPGHWEVVAPEPTPLEAIVLTETVEDLLRGLEPPERLIVELSLQGCTAPEIKEQTGRSERTVRRVRERVRHKLQRMQDDAAK